MIPVSQVIPSHIPPGSGQTVGMEKDIFWEAFRDTGEPMCWLLTRLRREHSPKDGDTRAEEEKRTSRPA